VYKKWYGFVIYFLKFNHSIIQILNLIQDVTEKAVSLRGADLNTKIMTTTELNLRRTQIIRMVCDESNEQVLSDVENLLTVNVLPFEDAPCCYSPEELKQRVRRATASIREGKGFTAEEMKSLHPRFV
jgi:hypothetical protein